MRSLQLTVSWQRRLVFGFGVLASLLVFLLLNGIRTPHAAAAGDCDSNAIIYCGVGSASELVSQARANDSKNGHHDLQSVYSYYGLEPGDYDRFINTAREGTLYRDGRLVVDGQTVATDTNSIGRNASAQGSNYFTITAGGKNYYGNNNNETFGSGVNSLKALVMFDASGAVEFAVIKTCGNPIGPNPVRPKYSCDLLNMDAVPGKLNTYDFSTGASASNNASIAKVVYDFGDGNTRTETNPGTKVRYEYKKNGTFTAKVTVYVKVPGDQQVAVGGAPCQKIVKVTLPYYQCVKLSGAIIDSSKYSYTFVADSKFGGGAKLVSANFDMGDGKKYTGVKPDANGTSITVAHTYSQAGKYSISATLKFSLNGSEVSASACTAGVTPTTSPTPECKPGIPVGDIRCTPCQYDSTLTADSPDCVVPPATKLPTTGAGNTIALFGGIAVVGFMIYRHLLFKKHKAAFHAAEVGTSPLPLASPLDDKTPLAGTPLDPQQHHHGSRHKPFRRRRSY